jgi:hypothetical protein
MMNSERASIFDTDEIDLSGFKPASRPKTPAAERAAIKEVAEQRGFTSREPVTVAPAHNDPEPRRQQRRHTTGRNRQLNIKATEETINRFYALADAQGWVLGEAFEHAVAALEAQCKTG